MRSVFDLEDRQQPVLFADGRKQLNQPPHVRTIVVELLLEHPGLVSRVAPDRCSRHRYHLDCHAHPLAGLSRRYRLASAGAGISAVYGLAMAMASTLGGIDQMGTLRRVAPGVFAQAGRRRRLAYETLARHRNDVRADNRVPFAPRRGRLWDVRRGHPGELWRSCGKVRAAPVEIREAREGTELGRSPRPRRMCATAEPMSWLRPVDGRAQCGDSRWQCRAQGKPVARGASWVLCPHQAKRPGRHESQPADQSNASVHFTSYPSVLAAPAGVGRTGPVNRRGARAADRRGDPGRRSSRRRRFLEMTL
jgi:hypothetical protein